MKEQIMNKETYERSSLTVTQFSEEDVIVTSGDDFGKFFKSLFGDNDTMMPNR